MLRRLATRALVCCFTVAVVTACDGSDGGPAVDAATVDVAVELDAALDGLPDAALPACGTPTQCASMWEAHAADRFDDLLDDSAGLADFLHDVPKGADLHNHLSGAVYAETLLGWAFEDGNCINRTTFAAVSPGSCSASTSPTPTAGTFFEQIIDAWSMRNFVPGAQSGRDHFFATFGKFGLIAANHRDDEIADLAIRAARENQLYIETMFNLGRNVGTLAADSWTGTLTAADLPVLFARIRSAPTFAAEIADDVAVVESARSGYRRSLGCDGATPPPACDVTVRFIAQVSRTGANDQIFGQLIGAFEMAAVNGQIVGANLSSPEDDTASINNYDLHMAMLDFLYGRYTAAGTSPLQITLHAGELTAASLPPGSTANTFHIRKAVQIAHAARIGHGLDILSETDSSALMDEMRDRNVLVEICLSSNDQILEVRGAAHPLAQYLAHGVPVALATDDQGVSRSSLAGEYLRAARDQLIDYRQLKTFARQSLEHAFVPGSSLWSAIETGTPTAACTPTDTMGVGTEPDATCQQLLNGSERARLQWELERRFLVFEQAQPAP